nr:Down syndrome cell adhesion molecule-like protein Dscam2 [Procambarus clarkii]
MWVLTLRLVAQDREIRSLLSPAPKHLGSPSTRALSELNLHIGALISQEPYLDSCSFDQGTGNGVSSKRGEVSDKVDEVSDKVDEVSDKVDEVSDKVDEVSDKVDEVSDNVDGVSDKVDEVSDKVDEVSDKVDEVSDKVDEVSDKVDEVSGKVDEVSGKEEGGFRGSERTQFLSKRWYRGSRPVGGSSGVWMVGGSLVLGRVGVEDTAQYTCVANNTAGETRYSAHLLVTLPVSVQVTPREVQVDAGGRLELRCHVSGEPVDTVTWYKDGTVLRSGGRVTIRPRESLHVSPVHASDAGVYQCAATYAQDYAHAQAYVTLGAAAPQLVYRFIEQTLQPGPAVSLKCIATGTPTPHITWVLDGFPIPPSHRYVKGQYVSAHGEVISHVNISTVHVTDGGTYRCTAENSAGSVVHSARLNVYGPPHVRPMGQVSAVAGETFLVTCPVSGHPVHKITWKKDGVRLPTTHRQRVHANGTLVVEQVTRGTDDGQYSCTASTRQGLSDTQHLTVRVMGCRVLPAPQKADRNLEGSVHLCIATLRRWKKEAGSFRVSCCVN